jgi:hypothetical protein
LVGKRAAPTSASAPCRGCTHSAGATAPPTWPGHRQRHRQRQRTLTAATSRAPGSRHRGAYGTAHSTLGGSQSTTTRAECNNRTCSRRVCVVLEHSRDGISRTTGTAACRYRFTRRCTAASPGHAGKRSPSTTGSFRSPTGPTARCTGRQHTAAAGDPGAAATCPTRCRSAAARRSTSSPTTASTRSYGSGHADAWRDSVPPDPTSQ